MTDPESRTETRIETSRLIAAPAAAIFALLCDPQGHLAIDSSGMLQGFEGEPVSAAGDSFRIHMDRESLNDYPEMGTYDVTVTIRDFECDRLISWSILGRVRPQIGHVYGYRLECVTEPGDESVTASNSTLVTSFYDWSHIHPDWAAMGIFPVLSENALRGTLGILDRTVRRGYVRT